MKVTVISPKRERFDPNRMEFWEFGFMTKAAGSGSRKFSGTPLALPIIASLLPDDFEVTLIDENVEDIDWNIDPDFVVLTFFTTAATRGYYIADQFRQANAKVIIGGCHASMLPDEAIAHADAVAIGEAEALMPRIAADMRKGKLKRFYRIKESERPNLNNIPIPRWDRLKLHRYFNPTIQTMRGCPYNCEFCTVRVHWGSKYRYKPIEKVVQEVEFLKENFGRNTFFMVVDDDIAANKKRSKELFKALIPLNVQWMSQGSLAMARDEEFLELMTISGGTRIIIGFETLSEANLKNIGKNPANKLSEYTENIRKIQSYGIGVIGAFVFGFDDDDVTCFENTANFIIENHIALPQLFTLTPFPGTALAYRLEKEGRILTKDWKLYTGSTALFLPTKMSTKELEEGYYYIIQKVYSYHAIWTRLTKLWFLFDKYAPKDKGALLKEKIDILLLNENFRAVAYSYPRSYTTDNAKEQHYKKQLQSQLKDLLNQRTDYLTKRQAEVQVLK
jgi:radical SAM superfamily enzyme YgiQ (UPF0313 family)